MAKEYKYDQPFHSVTLLPVERPSLAQIKAVLELSLLHAPWLKVRSILQVGGFQTFGLLFADQAAQLGEKLSAVGIPHRIDPLPDRRFIRE